MDEELVKRLRETSIDFGELDHISLMLLEAADAIEELQQTAEHYRGCADDWYKEACDFRVICEQMKAAIIFETRHTKMYDERDKKMLIEMAKSLPFQIIPYKDKKPRWIPVEKRLPIRGDRVICFGDNGINIVDFVCGDKWCALPWFYLDGEQETGVTHWMPLPDLPEEEDE